jgi:hypothetical protein
MADVIEDAVERLVRSVPSGPTVGQLRERLHVRRRRRLAVTAVAAVVVVVNGLLVLGRSEPVGVTPSAPPETSASATTTPATTTSSATLSTTSSTSPNRPPIAVDDLVALLSGEQAQVQVLANDVDPDGGRLSLVSVALLSDGATLEILADSVRIAPDPDFVGITTFAYTISDAGGLTSSATVTVVVSPPPTPV